jgi:hypothetical protein
MENTEIYGECGATASCWIPPALLEYKECWLNYINNAEGELMEEIMAQEPLIQKAYEIEKAFMADADERYLYEMDLKSRMDYANAMMTEIATACPLPTPQASQ